MQRQGGTPQMWTLLSFTGCFDVAFLEDAIAKGANNPPRMPGERTDEEKAQVRTKQHMNIYKTSMEREGGRYMQHSRR